MKAIGIKGVFNGLALCASIGASVWASAGQAAVVYTDGANNFTGSYHGVGTFSVNFNATAGLHALSFDLFGANSVDGQGNGWDDIFAVALNGVTVFTGLFNMSGGGDNAITLNPNSWTTATTTNPGGFFQGGVTSVAGLANLVAGNNLFAVTFSSPGPFNNGDQGTGDESWALNDLDVSPATVPLPAALPLMGFALAGLAALGQRRRKLVAV